MCKLEGFLSLSPLEMVMYGLHMYAYMSDILGTGYMHPLLPSLPDTISRGILMCFFQPYSIVTHNLKIPYTVAVLICMYSFTHLCTIQNYSVQKYILKTGFSVLCCGCTFTAYDI